MKREDIKRLVDERLGEIGCPLTNRYTRIVPSKLVIEVAVGDRRLVFEVKSGLPETEIRAKLAEFERRYLNSKGQVDIERAIEDTMASVIAAE